MTTTTLTSEGIDLDAALDEVLDNPDPTTHDHQATGPADPYIDAIPHDQLFPDTTYQRDLDVHRVTKMAAAFRIALVGIIEVSQRPDGRYAILDGQHRWAVVRDVSFGDPRPRALACRVHTGLTVTQEAALYHELNTTRKQLTGWDRWVARRRAGDPDALAIEAAAHRAGFKIGMQAAPGVLRATKACENVVNLGGIGLLDQVFDTVRAAYNDDQAGLDASIVAGLGHVLHHYDRDELDTARLVEALAGVVPRQLTARAAAVRELHQGTLDRLTAHVVVERYNATKGTKIPAFFDRVKPLSKAKPDKTQRRAAAIRGWADQQGIEISTKRIPKAVRDAYDARHDTEAEAAS